MVPLLMVVEATTNRAAEDDSGNDVLRSTHKDSVIPAGTADQLQLDQG
jgi:hypothetical protein